MGVEAQGRGVGHGPVDEVLGQFQGRGPGQVGESAEEAAGTVLDGAGTDAQ
jgi:hypothetical protein